MNVEELLASARPCAPSPGLDARMEGLLGRAPARRAARPGLLIAFCSLGAAAAVAAALALRSPRLEPGRPPAGARRIEATGAFQQLLLTPPSSRRPMPRMEVSVASR
jgi:hypothetical protein